MDDCWKCDNRGYYLEEYWVIGDSRKYYEFIPCGCKKENILTDKCSCKCDKDDINIKVPYSTVVKADQMLFLVGQHGAAVLDEELKKEMIKTASELRRIFMRMKGE